MNIFSFFFALFRSYKFLKAGGLNTWLLMEPSPSASAELVSNQFPKTTDANLNTQVSGATSTGARKKRLLDKAYRERCKVKPLFSSLFGFSLKFSQIVSLSLCCENRTYDVGSS